MKRPMFGQRYSYDGHGFRPQQFNQQSAQSNLAPMPSREQNPEHWKPNRQTEERGSGTSQGESHRDRPTTGDGANPPFRVLHSYNSPAYKGVPIWG
jgi:hypothetical protein